MLKKLTTLLAVAAVLAACAACGVKNDPEPPQSSPEKTSSEEAQ